MMRKEICCDECGVSEFSEPVDECTCDDYPVPLCIPCHRKLHPVSSASKINWGEIEKFEGHTNEILNEWYKSREKALLCTCGICLSRFIETGEWIT